jgi:lipopolysaccharide export system permease protein
MLKYQSDKNWRIIGGGTLLSVDGRISMELKGDAWPPEVPEMSISPEDLLRQDLKDLDALSLSQTREQIRRGRSDPHVSRKQYANLQYGFWNKFALPLAALVYGLLGAPLGIRNVRTGAATGFAVSVAIIFLYITLANLMNVYAMGGVIPAYVASFTPLLIGMVAAGVIIWRRNG